MKDPICTLLIPQLERVSATGSFGPRGVGGAGDSPGKRAGAGGIRESGGWESSGGACAVGGGTAHGKRLLESVWQCPPPKLSIYTLLFETSTKGGVVRKVLVDPEPLARKRFSAPCACTWHMP